MRTTVVSLFLSFGRAPEKRLKITSGKPVLVHAVVSFFVGALEARRDNLRSGFPSYSPGHSVVVFFSWWKECPGQVNREHEEEQKRKEILSLVLTILSIKSCAKRITVFLLFRLAI